MVFPWNERNGRLSPLKLVVFMALFVPGAIVALRFGLGGYGAEPIKNATREIGLWAVRLLFLSLAITPARRLLHWPRLVVVRRMIGVAAFAYALVHLSVYTIDQGLDLAKVAQEIVLRFYLTIGFVALLGLTALAATSTDGMMRRMGGRAWQRLHYLAYPIGLLALTHFFLQARIDLREPMVMAGLLAWLMLFRLHARLSGEASPSIPWAAGLGLAAAGATALAEATYYWIKTGVDPVRVLEATASLRTGLRPGLVVLVLILATTALAVGRAAFARTSKPVARRS
jgi:sulfoxide reductase heme-binding subunit YedZ